jgi:hypothetical protein
VERDSRAWECTVIPSILMRRASLGAGAGAELDAVVERPCGKHIAGWLRLPESNCAYALSHKAMR